MVIYATPGFGPHRPEGPCGRLATVTKLPGRGDAFAAWHTPWSLPARRRSPAPPRPANPIQQSATSVPTRTNRRTAWIRACCIGMTRTH